VTALAPAAIVLQPMTLGDLEQVVAIDRLSFPQPWSEGSYRFELTQNQAAHFWVALAPEGQRSSLLDRVLGRPQRTIVGYGGLWHVVDEAHINTLAVHPDWRGRRVGERLLICLLDDARRLGAVTATLEVRVSNVVAQGLYRRFGFLEVGRRPRYYADHEDALLMTAYLGGRSGA